MRESLRYSYTRVNPAAPLRPLLQVSLQSGSFSESAPVLCLVDSGADRNIFPIEFAISLNLTLDAKHVWPFYGTTGRIQHGYLHAVKMCIHDTALCSVAFSFSTEVAFCENFRFPVGPLLGQNGFFSHFKTLFDQKNGTFRLREN